jgi:hypothetical protein
MRLAAHAPARMNAQLVMGSVRVNESDWDAKYRAPR